MNHLPSQADHPPDQPPRAGSTSPTAAPAYRIGQRVRTARLAANLTQDVLAGTSYSKSYISAVERGKMTPSLPALRFLAERLGVTLSYFLGEEPSVPPVEVPTAPAEESEQTTRLCKAERVLQEGRYEEAIARFEQVGQPDRTSWAHEQYAQFLAAQERYQDAYEQMRLAFQGRRG